MITTFKRAGLLQLHNIARIFNPTNRAVTGKIKLHKNVKKAWLCNLNEEREKPLKPTGKTITVKAGKKKIVTIEFQI